MDVSYHEEHNQNQTYNHQQSDQLSKKKNHQEFKSLEIGPRHPESEPPRHLLDGKIGESERATTSPDKESKRSSASPTRDSGGVVASLDGESKMIIKGGDRGTISSSGEESGFTTRDCGSAGTGSTRASVGSGGAASLGLTIQGTAP